jgi:hypothetical protein
LYVTFASFGMLACLAGIGGLLAAQHRQVGALVPLAPLLLGVFLTTTLFHPSTRYRLPLLIVFAPLAGYACARAEQALRQGHWPLSVIVAAIVLGFGLRSATRGLQHPGVWQMRVAESAAMANDLPECRSRVRAALEAEPDSPEVGARIAFIRVLLPSCGSL